MISTACTPVAYHLEPFYTLWMPYYLLCCRDAFRDLLAKHRAEGIINAATRWKVCAALRCAVLRLLHCAALRC